MRRRLVVFLAGAMTLIGLAGVADPTPAHATAHGRNGRIAFRRYLNAEQTRGALFTINPDGTGTGIRQVTHPRRMTVTTNPDWNPNRRWIAYSRYGQAVEDNSRLYKIHPNGTGRTSLSGSCTGRCVTDDQAEWGPHGKRIAFQRGLKFRPNGLHNTFIFVMRANGTHPRRITQLRADPSVVHHFEDRAPTWSPDATRLAFERHNQSDAEAGSTTAPSSPCAWTARDCAGSHRGAWMASSRTGLPTAGGWCSTRTTPITPRPATSGSSIPTEPACTA